jgi:hypothetical protein
MASPASAVALPAPCPGTVRLALVRVGIECFGFEDTRDALFPIIRSASIAIRPPERVALSNQQLRMYKAYVKQGGDHLEESIGYREVAHAQGVMTVYIEVPAAHQDTFRDLFSAIGYWGQASSLAQCLAVEHCKPVRSECAVPLRQISPYQPLRGFVTGLASDFRGPDVEWHHIMPDPAGNADEAIRIDLYVWPMRIIEQRGDSRLLLRCSISELSQ